MTKLNELFKTSVKIVNIGLPSFAEDLRKQGLFVQSVDWRPPAGGSKKIQALLDRVKKSQAGFQDEVKK